MKPYNEFNISVQFVIGLEYLRRDTEFVQWNASKRILAYTSDHFHRRAGLSPSSSMLELYRASGGRRYKQISAIFGRKKGQRVLVLGESKRNKLEDIGDTWRVSHTTIRGGCFFLFAGDRHSPSCLNRRPILGRQATATSMLNVQCQWNVAS